jgi:hypothetical protein
LLENGVSATKEAKQLLDGIVSSMMGGGKDDGKGMKNMLNSGVSASGETDEKLLTIGVSATGGEKGCWCFNGKSCCECVAAEGGGKERNKCWTELFRE